jgi:archaellin
MKRLDKKAVMGIGMLLIFVATVVASAISAGVLITATNSLKESALQVSEETNRRLTDGPDLFALYAQGNQSDETLYQFEALIRPRPGSNPVQLKVLGLSITTADTTVSARFNETVSEVGTNGSAGACTFANLTNEKDFCVVKRLADDDTLLEKGEFVAIKHELNTTNALGTEEKFEFTLTPKTGRLVSIELVTPELVLANKIRLR